MRADNKWQDYTLIDATDGFRLESWGDVILVRPDPQVLINVKTTAEGKAFYKKDEIIEGFIEAKQQQLMGAGRVLVRLSGTEPLIRVMVEGESLEKITDVANAIVDKIKERLATIGA